jgi:hypothetical protein
MQVSLNSLNANYRKLTSHSSTTFHSVAWTHFIEQKVGSTEFSHDGHRLN